MRPSTLLVVVAYAALSVGWFVLGVLVGAAL